MSHHEVVFLQSLNAAPAAHIAPSRSHQDQTDTKPWWSKEHPVSSSCLSRCPSLLWGPASCESCCRMRTRSTRSLGAATRWVPHTPEDYEEKLWKHCYRYAWFHPQVQGLQRAAAKMLASNRKLAKVSLSKKPAFRDSKLLLAKKYKELETLRSIIEAKQEQLGEFETDLCV